MPSVAILGAGLSGLYLGKRLREKGISVRILEASDGVGGLCRTVRRGAHSWDLGPHAFYSKNPSAMEYYRALPLDYARLRRDVKICHGAPGAARELAYPFENGLADLPLSERWECVRGYLSAARKRPRDFRSLQDWIDRGLGRGIARLFMQPYNEKIWNHPLDGISMALVSGKIEPEPPWRVVRNALVRGSVGRAYQAEFLYPAQGAGAIPNAVAAGLGDAVSTGWRVSRVRPAPEGGWRVVSATGQEVAADGVVSTIPIPALLRALDDPELNGHAGAFASNDTWFVAVGLKPGRDFGRFSRCHWVFFAGPETFYRVALMRAFAASGPATLVAEITRKGPLGALSADALGARVLADLLAHGIVAAESDVELIDARLEPNTYPIPTLGFAAARRAVEEKLEKRRLFLLGRNGRWDYINTDGVFLAVEALLQSRLRELGARS